MATQSGGFGLRSIAILLVIAISLVCVVVPLILTAPRVMPGRSQCRANMKQVALAMHLYHQDHGTFPPAYTTDADGTRLHSWRTLLLPYLEMRQLYEQINLSQPWDSPYNQQFHDVGTYIFRCPRDRSDTSELTSYMVIVGEETMFPPDGQSRSVDSMTDSASTTILLVETDGRGTHWMQPDDLEFDKMTFQVNGGTTEIAGNHMGVAHVAMADTSVRSLPDDFEPPKLKALVTPSGGEPVELNW